MNFIQFITSENFELCTLIVAVLCAATDFTLKKIKSVPAPVANYSPLFISLCGTFIAELIVCGKIEFTETLFYTALTAYSLGIVASVFLRRILRGENAGDTLVALVQGIAESVCKDDSEAAFSKIAAILSAVKNSENENGETLKNRVLSVLESVKKDGVSAKEISAVTERILLSAKQLKKEK